MIYYETEKQLRKEVLDYIKTLGDFAKSTIGTYRTDSFNVLETDKGIDFWEMIGNKELSDYAKMTIESSWTTWTILHSRHVKVNNYHSYIMGIDRINDFVTKYPEWIDRVRQQSTEVNNYLYNRCDEELSTGYSQDKINLLAEEFKEKIGPYDNEVFETRITTYLYIKGYFPIEEINYKYRIYTDMMQVTLLNMEKDEIPMALQRVKDSIVKLEHNNYYKYEHRREWLKELAEKNNIEIDLSDNIFKGSVREELNYTDKDLWSISDMVDNSNINNVTTYINNDEDLEERIANIPEGNHVFSMENVRVREDDIYYKEFKKGILVKGLYEVVQNYQDGKRLDLKIINNNQRIWYHDTYPNNFSYFPYTNWKNTMFIDFLLEGKKQDMQLYLEKYGKFKDIIEKEVFDETGDETKSFYTDDLFMDSQEIQELTTLILKKKNVILQGAPGVGKTFSAKRLAYSILGAIDDSKVAQIQFHQSYSYEDLVMGYRPTEDGFELKNGPFYDFCKIAAEDLENEYFFIIDEINRGNISKIFGELLMLIESDKRGENNSIELIYTDEPFYVPKNLHIIGMMNTADRSLAMIDYAFRRRFAFYELKPAFDNEKFKLMLSNTSNYKLKQLVELLKDLNKEIIHDESLGKGFAIGHSYVTKNNIVEDAEVLSIIKYEILPLLEEYWFDEEDKYNKWSNKLMGV